MLSFFIWHIGDSNHTKMWSTSKYWTFLRHDEKQRAINSLHCEFLQVKEKKKKNSGWNPLLSSGRLHKQWKLNEKTNLFLHGLWILLRGGRWDWETDRQTDRNKGKDGEKVSSLSTRQLVFKGLGVQNQPIPFQLCEEECLHELPAVMVQRRSTSSQNQ